MNFANTKVARMAYTLHSDRTSVRRNTAQMAGQIPCISCVLIRPHRRCPGRAWHRTTMGRRHAVWSLDTQVASLPLTSVCMSHQSKISNFPHKQNEVSKFWTHKTPFQPRSMRRSALEVSLKRRQDLPKPQHSVSITRPWMYLPSKSCSACSCHTSRERFRFILKRLNSTHIDTHTHSTHTRTPTTHTTV